MDNLAQIILLGNILIYFVFDCIQIGYFVYSEYENKYKNNEVSIMEAKEFGGYLKELRKRKKLTLKDLSQKAELTVGYLSNIENGRRGIPSPEILKKLAGPLGESPINLMIEAGHINIEDDFASKTQSLLKSLKDKFKGRRQNVAIVYLTTAISSKLRELIIKYESSPLAVASLKGTDDLILDYLDNDEVTVDEVIHQNSLEFEGFEDDVKEDKGQVYLLLETLNYIEKQENQFNALKQQLIELKNKDLENYISEEVVMYNDHELSDEDKQRLINMLPILFPQYQSEK